MESCSERHFSLGKTSISFFNILHAFFFIPFTVVLLMNGYGFQVILWHLGIMALIYANNFINVLLNNKDSVFYSILAVVASLGLAQYYQIFDVTNYTQPFFQGMYSTNFLFLIPICVFLTVLLWSFSLQSFNINTCTIT